MAFINFVCECDIKHSFCFLAMLLKRVNINNCSVEESYLVNEHFHIFQPSVHITSTVSTILMMSTWIMYCYLLLLLHAIQHYCRPFICYTDLQVYIKVVWQLSQYMTIAKNTSLPPIFQFCQPHHQSLQCFCCIRKRCKSSCISCDMHNPYSLHTSWISTVQRGH